MIFSSVLTTLLLVATCSAYTINGPPPVNTIDTTELTGRALVDHINSVQTSWVAEYNEISEYEMKFKVMDKKFAEPLESSEVLVMREIAPESLPDSFDARDNWPHCNTIKSIRNQATCGSCWAFAAAEIISDRICIQSNGTQQPIISVEDILSCCTTCGDADGSGCQGGYSLKALQFWMSSGVVTGGGYEGHGCMPYSIRPCSSCRDSATPSCKTTCQSGYNTEYKADKHFGTSAYQLPTKNVAAIQTEIYHNGPVAAVYNVYNDFDKYRSGVYHHVSGKYSGEHEVKIIGWGTQNGDDYWLVANSWGTGFGEKGFFKIRRGTNECGIENTVVAGVAKLGTHPEKTDDDSATSCSFVMSTLVLLSYYLI